MSKIKKVIFVASTSYSGSTMIDLTLSNDPKGFSCGESNFIYHPEQAHHLAPRCACGDPTCRIWFDLKGTHETELYTTLFKQHPEINFIVDSSKDPFWVARQSDALAKAGIKSEIIVIWKSPEEMASSFHSRHRLEHWKRHWLSYHRLLFRQFGTRFHAVSYRDFVKDPKSLKAICQKLEIPYFAGKENYWESCHHTLFGNGSARRHLNDVEAAVHRGQYTDANELRSVYYKQPGNPEVLKQVYHQKLEDPLIGKVHKLLLAQSISQLAELPAGLAMPVRDVVSRRVRRYLPRLAVVKGRVRTTFKLPPVAAAKSDANKKQIAFVLPAHQSAVIGGAEYQAGLILSELKAKTGELAEVTYICRKGNLGFSNPSHRLSILPHIPILARYAYFIDLPFLFQRLRSLHPAVIYNRDIGAYTAACSYYAKLHNAKLVIHLAHDKDVTPMPRPFPRNFLKRIDKALLEYGLRRADMVVAQTPEQADLLKRHYDITAQLILPNVQPVPTKSEVSKQIDAPVVLWVANFKDFKQPEVFVELARRLVDTSAQFLMVGQAGESFAPLFRDMASMGNLRYLGPLSHKEVLKLFDGASVFVNTSTAEGFPNTFIEAWMREVPVVSLFANPYSSLSGEFGYCAGDIDTMEEDMRRILGSSELRKSMGKLAREYSVARFGLRSLEPLLDVLYE